ncbi:MAG: carbon monoxide dehydrogenase subunit G [Anaerolineae bacterium]
MKIEGTHTFAAPRDTVWPMLMDPEVLASVMPGCEKLEQFGENQYKGILKIRVGPVQGKFNGVVTLSEISEPGSFRLSVDGKGAPGFVKGSGVLHLESDGSTTLLRYEGEAQVGGRIASVGQRLLDTSARAIIRQSLDGLEQQVQARMGPESAEGGTAAAAAVAPPSQTQFAAGVVRNMLAELIPPEQRDELITRSLIVIGAVVFFRLISNWWTNRLARRIAKLIREKEV